MLTRRTPLKPGTKRMKSRHRAIGAATKAEKAQQDAQRARGCALCELLGVHTGLMVRIHHRTLADIAGPGSVQLGQDATVALCDWHHQGIPRAGFNTEHMRRRYGPSLFHHKRALLELLLAVFGQRSTEALQRYQDDLIAGREPVLLAVPCEFCFHPFDPAAGLYGCPNCHGEGLATHPTPPGATDDQPF